MTPSGHAVFEPAIHYWGTYAEIALALGLAGGARAVARACATNRIALLIPCHRVVGSNGMLRGYRSGIRRKAALLERETPVED